MTEIKQKIESKLLECDRPGMEGLVSWLNGTDFFSAPASTKYHGCHEGGLAEHSLQVCTLLFRKGSMAAKAPLCKDNIIICGLLHDVCKAGVYKKTWKNVKNYHDRGQKKDEGGRFDWEAEESYVFGDPLPLGHGAKSLYLVRRHIELSDMEAAMILHHMGAFPGGDAARDFSAAANKWPAVALMHAADIEASYCYEERKGAPNAGNDQ
jgi:hypothetical protein